ncbi:MAG TPA: hypothetical protein VD902_22220 [Symbiobacteriaceae bacterium]|nr:hypothetical protein [Symbiobacteriaceae bacterium]
MAGTSEKTVSALLVVAVALQAWILVRQGRLEQQMQNLTVNQNQLGQRIQHEVNSLHGRIGEMAEAERWLSVEQVELEPAGTCNAAMAKVQWELLQWAADTKVRLLYRAGKDEAWHETPVETLGGQNYAAAFGVPVKPMLEVGLAISDETGRGNRVMHEGTASEKASFDQSIQYQILSEGPGFNRSSGIKSLPFQGEWVAMAKMQIRMERAGRYSVDLFAERAGRSRCAEVESARVTAYAGDRAVFSGPMAPADESQRSARWTSEEPISRLEIAIRYGGIEEVIPVNLAGQ